MLAITCGGSGRSLLNGPPGAANISTKDKMIRINSVGTATASRLTMKLNMERYPVKNDNEPGAPVERGTGP